MNAIPLWTILLPPIATAVLCALGSNPVAIARVSVIGSLLSFFSCLCWGAVVFISGSIMGKSSAIRLDALGSYLTIIVTFICLGASIASAEFMSHEARSENLGIRAWRIYYGLLHLFVGTMLVVAIANNLGLLWIAVEATTLSTAFLVGFHHHRHSVEAAWKYVILCSIGIAFALLGTILLYYASLRSGNGHNLDWTSFMNLSKNMDPKLLKLAFLFAVLGYGTKAGLAPMHTWLPDAHSQAPSPISAALSGVLLTSALFALTRFYTIAVSCLGTKFPGTVLIIFGVASLLVATPFILVARDYKRMLAYSSVEHMGLMTFGLGLGTPLSIYGMLLYALSHACAKGLAFLSAGRMFQIFGTRKIHKIKALLTTDPEIGVPFFFSVLALAGLPPFGIFTSKFLILSAAFSSEYYLVSALVLLLLGIVFGGLLYHLMELCFGKNILPAAHFIKTRSWSWRLIAVSSLALLIGMGVWIPAPLDSWLKSMTEIIRGSRCG